jgi:hypothetical protein
LTTDTLYEFLLKNRGEAITLCTFWDNLQHQVFLGDETFVEKHQLMQNSLKGDVSEIPFKQHSVTPLNLGEYQQQAETHSEAIIKAYQLTVTLRSK